MKHKDLKALLCALWKMGAHDGSYVPLLIWGEAGIGKTQVVRETVRELFPLDSDEDDISSHIIDLRIGNMDPSDLIGVPAEQLVFPCPICEAHNGLSKRYESRDLVQHIRAFARKDRNHKDVVERFRFGTEISQWAQQRVRDMYGDKILTRTVFSMPDWFPVDETGETGGILFLDEINRGQKDTIQAVFQLVLDRKLHLHDLPSNWIVVAASNPSDTRGGHKYIVADEFTKDTALSTRFLHVGLEVDSVDWLDYAGDNHIEDSIRFLIASNGRVVESSDSVISFRIVATPRTYDFLSRICKSDLPKNLLLHVANGLIGHDKAATWMTLRDYLGEPLTIDELLNQYTINEKVRNKFLDQLAEKKPEALQGVTELWGYLKRQNISVSDVQINNIAEILLDMFNAHPEHIALYMLRDPLPINIVGRVAGMRKLDCINNYIDKYAETTRSSSDGTPITSSKVPRRVKR